jgi:hypothetical protein
MYIDHRMHIKKQLEKAPRHNPFHSSEKDMYIIFMYEPTRKDSLVLQPLVMQLAFNIKLD